MRFWAALFVHALTLPMALNHDVGASMDLEDSAPSRPCSPGHLHCRRMFSGPRSHAACTPDVRKHAEAFRI